MKCNIGKTDRIIRYVLGAIVLAWGLLTKNWWGLIGLIPIITAAIRWCPLYIPFNTSSCGKDCNCEKK